MSKLHVFRNHNLGLLQMRENAFGWAQQAESDFQMNCVYEEGETKDAVLFTKPGVNGRLLIDHDTLEIHIHLSILMTPFKKMIESKILKNLDDILKRKIIN